MHPGGIVVETGVLVHEATFAATSQSIVAASNVDQHQFPVTAKVQATSTAEVPVAVVAAATAQAAVSQVVIAAPDIEPQEADGAVIAVVPVAVLQKATNTYVLEIGTKAKPELQVEHVTKLLVAVVRALVQVAQLATPYGEAVVPAPVAEQEVQTAANKK